MTTNDYLITKIDLDVKRRRALANVYEFLLKLAESAKRQPEDSIQTRSKTTKTFLKKKMSHHRAV
jgi:hypothetical protein